MSNAIDFNSIDQIKDLECELKTDFIILTTKKGDEIKFYICEIEPKDFFSMKDSVKGVNVSDGKVDINDEKQFEMAVDMFALTIINKDGKRIGKDKKVIDFINKSFTIQEIVKAIQAAMDISGLSETAIKETEKN